MADQQRRVSLIFDADTGRAMSQINQLADSLKKVMDVSTRSTGVASLDKQLQAAAKDAAQLQVQLKNATNATTGKLDLTKFNDSLKSSNMSLEKYQQSFSNLGATGEQAFTNLARSIATAEIPLRRTSGVLDQFATTMKNTVKWQLSSSIMHGFLSSVQSAMSYAQNLNKNLTDIRIVTGQSADDMARFAEQANKSARELSSTTNQYAQAALIFYQQGLGDKAVKERTDTVIKMANVTREASKDVSSYMTAIWNNFDDGSKSLEYYADAITKLGAATAASSAEIAGGLEKFAAIGDTIGLSYEYATAMVTTIIDKTRQSEDVVGTALKAILARIQGLRLGETLEDGTTLNVYSAALAKVGVNIKDASGELKDMDIILDELGAKWQSLSRDVQVALAQTVGGVRQYNQIISLMNNWEAFKSNVNIAKGAEGSLQEQADIYAESWEAAQKRVRAAAEAIYSSLVDDKFFIGMNNMFSEVLDQVKNFIEGMGGVRGILISLGALVTTIFGNQITAALKNFTNNISMATKTGQAKIIAIQKKAQELLQANTLDKGTAGGAIASDAYAKEAKMQLMLINNAKKMSTEEAEIARILMQRLQYRTDEQVKAGMQADSSEREMERTEALIQHLRDAMTVQPVGLQAAINNIKEFGTAVPQIETLDAAFIKISNSVETDAIKIQQIKELINSFPANSLPAKAAADFDKMKESINTSGLSLAEVQNKFNEFYGSIQEKGDGAKVFLDSLNATIQKMKDEGQDPKLIQQYQNLSTLLSTLGANAENYGKSLNVANIAQMDAAQAAKALEQYFTQTGIVIMGTQEKIVTFAKILSSLGMIYNQIKGMINVWKDDSKSFGEQLLTTASTIGFMIPMIVSMVNGISSLGKSAAAAALAIKIKTTAMTEDAIATQTAAVKNMTYGKSLLVAMPYVAAAVAAIGLLILAVKQYQDLSKVPENSLQKQLQSLRKEAEELTSSLQDSKAKAEEIKGVFDNYNSVYEALSNCASNTQEWRDRLQEVKELEADILLQHPELIDFMKEAEKLGYGTDSYKDESGNLNIKAILQDYLDYQNKAAELTSMALIENERKISRTETLTSSRSDREKLIEDYFTYDSDIFGSKENRKVASGRTLEYELGKSDNIFYDIQTTLGISDLEASKWTYGDFISGAFHTIYEYGLQNGIENFQEATKAWMEQYDYFDQESARTQLKMYSGTDNFYDTFSLLAGETGLSLINSLYSLELGKNIEGSQTLVASSYLSGIYKNLDLSGYSSEIQESITGTLGLLLEQKIIDSLNLETIDIDTAIEDFLTNNEEYDDLKVDALTGNYTGYKDGEQVGTISRNQILMDSAEAMNRFNNIDTLKLLDSILNVIPEIAQSRVFSGSLEGYTGQDLNELSVALEEMQDSEESNDLMASIYGENWYDNLFTQVNEAMFLIKNTFKEGLFADVSYDQFKQFDNLPSAIKNYLTSEIFPQIKSSEILQKILDFDFNNGQQSIKDFATLGQEYGFDTRQNSFEYSGFASAILRSSGVIDNNLKAWGAMNEEQIKELVSLSQGESIDSKAYEELKIAGFDLEGINKSGIGYKGSTDLIAPLESLKQAQFIQKDYFKTIGDFLTINSQSPYANAIAQALGFENYDDYSSVDNFHLRASSEFQDKMRNFDPMSISEYAENQNYIDNFDASGIFYVMSQMGTMYADVMEEYDANLANQYVGEMVKRQAELEGITLSNDELAQWTDISQITSENVEWANFLNSKKVQSGISGIASSITSQNELDFIKSILDKNGVGVTLDEQNKLDSFKTNINNIAGRELSNDELSQYWFMMEDLISGNLTSAFFAISSLNPELPEEEVWAWAQALVDSTTIQLNDILSEALSTAIGSKDFSDKSLKELKDSQNELEGISKIDAEGNRVSKFNEEGAKSYLKALSLFDKEGITGEGIKVAESFGLTAETTASNLLNAIINAGYEGIKEAENNLDVESLGKRAKSSFRESYQNILQSILESTGDIDNSTADTVLSAYENANKYGAVGVAALDKVFAAAQSKGMDLTKVAASMAGIDWSSASIEDIQIAFEKAGLHAEDLDFALEDLMAAMQNAVTYTDALTEALNGYASNTSIADKIRSGDELTTEEYGQAVKELGPELAQQMFAMTANGGYLLDKSYDKDIVGAQFDSYALTDINASQSQIGAILDQLNFGNLNTESLLFAGNNLDDTRYNLDETSQASINSAIESLIQALTSKDQEAIDQEYSNLDRLLSENNMTRSDFMDTTADVANQKSEELNEMAIDAESRIPRENWEKEVTDLGLDVDEVGELGDSIQDMAKSSDELADSLEDDADAADEVAKELKRYDKALKSVEDNYEDWQEALESDNIEMQTEAIGEMDKAYSDLLDIDYGSLSDEFLTNADNLELMREAANGSEEAYNQLQSLAQQDILTHCKMDTDAFNAASAEVQSKMAEMNFEDIEVGAELNDEGFLQSLSDLVNATNMTAQQAQSYLASMGIDAEVVEDTTQVRDVSTYTGAVPSVSPVGFTGTNPITGLPQRYVFPSVTYSPRPMDVEGDKAQTSFALKVTSANKSSGGGFKHSNSGGGRRRGGGGGGGGGGSRAPRAEKKTDTDKERYHTVTNQLEDLTDTYDKVSKAADRAFGKTRIRLLREQEDALKDLAATQQDYIDEINEYYKQDLGNLDQVSQYVGFEVQLDENDTITNFDEIQNAMLEEYNSHINDKGEVTDMDEEAWGEYGKEWERIMALIEQYDETQDLRKEALQQLQDYINEIYDLQLEEITYAVEVDIDASDDALEILDYMLGKIEDDAWDAAEAIAYMGSQATEMLDQNNTYNSAIRDILNNHTKDILDANGKVVHKADLTQADVEGFMTGDQSAIQKIMGMNDAFTDEEIQSLRDYHSELLALNESLIELRETVYDKILESFEAFNDEMDKSIDKIDHLSQVTENYRNIIDIVGKKNLGISNALVEAMNQAAVEQEINRVTATRVKMETIGEEIAMAEEKLADARARGLEEDAKLWEQSIEEMKKALDEAEEDFMQSWEDALNSAKELYELTVTNALESLSDSLAGPLHDSLEELEEAFDRQGTIGERYLPDYEKIYELNKLNRDISNSIDDTDNIKGKQELAKLQAEINDLEESEAQISEYQMENLRRRYELKLAELALNESKNAKSQVQMSRSSDGSWSYVYTADEEQVAEAEQNYEDRLFAMQEANAEYINNLGDTIMQFQTDTYNRLQEIATDESLSMEERIAKTQETIVFYNEQMQYYSSELGLVLDENSILYENDWTKYHELTGYKISDNENYVTQFNETALGVATGFDAMEQFQQNFNDAIGSPDTGGYLYDLNNAYQVWKENTEAAMQEAGTSVDGFKDKMAEDTTDIISSSEIAADQINEDSEEIITAFEEISDAVQNWANEYSATIDSILERNEALVKSFNEVLKAFSDYEEGTQIDDSEEIAEEQPTEQEEPSGGIPDEPVDISKEEKAEKYGRQIAAAIWEAPGGAGWDSGRGPKGKRYLNFESKGMDGYIVQEFVDRMTHKTRKQRLAMAGVNDVSELDPYRFKNFAFDTGGYTGAWGTEGRWAMLHEKEIVLNKEDTSNLLNAVNMIRQIAEIIDLNAYSSAGFGSTISAFGSGNAGTLEQNVHITAEFPNATNREEIYAAFTDIVNLASQYANRK